MVEHIALKIVALMLLPVNQKDRMFFNRLHLHAVCDQSF